MNYKKSKVRKVQIFSKKIKPKKSSVCDVYWQFAAERQEIFFKKLDNQRFPWTDDKIFLKYKFTNAYRASDRVSQYLIKNIINVGDDDPNEIIFRILLFKLFNKIETWEAIEKRIGIVSYKNYNYAVYDKILEDRKKQGMSIYSGAYIMASANNAYGFPLKHQNHLKLIEQIIRDNLPKKIIGLKSLESLYSQLLSYPTIGPFLAYQYAIDINYSDLTNFSEMEFVKAGPGAKDGIKKCFTDMGDYSEEDVIRMMAEEQFNEFEKQGLKFRTLWGRPLQLIDCQNLFCEVDKYLRVAHPEVSSISNRKRIKQQYKQSSLGKIDYVFPKKWSLNYKKK
jgi:hypothetical protein